MSLNHPHTDAGAASRVFEMPATLQELEWTRVLGAQGLGWQWVYTMAELAAPHFVLQPGVRAKQCDAELVEFYLEGVDHQVRFAYEQPLATTLLSALGRLVDAVNQAARRQHVGWRFVVTQEPSTGRCCVYRLNLLTHDELVHHGAPGRVVLGISLEDYELPARTLAAPPPAGLHTPMRPDAQAPGA